MTKALARIAVIGYGLKLCAVGATGIVLARWELANIFALDFGGMSQAEQATLLNQYRFLKGVELGAGLGCLMFLRAILDGGRATRWFLALAAGGILARSIAWIVDGRPHWAFLGFLALEALVVALTLPLLRKSAHG